MAFFIGRDQLHYFFEVSSFLSLWHDGASFLSQDSPSFFSQCCFSLQQVSFSLQHDFLIIEQAETESSADNVTRVMSFI
jgi:hypothetical protein